MRFFININNDEEFKQLFNFIADDINDDVYQLTNECGFDQDELFTFDEDETGFDDYRWKDVLPDYVTGHYYISICDMYDRIGDMSYRIILKIEEPKENITSLASNVKKLKSERSSINRKIDKDRMKKTYYTTQEEYTRLEEINFELEDKYGIGIMD